METAIVPGIYDPSVADHQIQASTERAFQLARAACRHVGRNLSPSSAANLDAAFQVANTLKSGHVVTVFPDNSMKYLDENFWSDDDYTIENPFV